MAIQANLTQPYPDLTAIENLAGEPVGLLNFPYEVTSVLDFTVDATIRAEYFPTPPAALAFLTGVFDYESEPPYTSYVLPISGVSSPYFFGGAVSSEGDFLEPTRGQIWPRIG